MASVETPFTGSDPGLLHTGDERWKLVLRIAASAGFRKAPRLRDFVIFVCDHVIRGETEELTEQHIGVEVFKRPQSYSTSEDNVVRAQARQVRLKLAEYFAGVGLEEPLLLEIPKGSYVPVFSVRQETLLQPVPGVAFPLPVPEKNPFRKLPALIAVSVLAAVLLAAFLVVFWDDKTVRAAAIVKESAAPLLPPFSWIFDNKQPTTLVVADSSFGLYQDLIGRTATLDEYLDPQFFTNHQPQSKARDIRMFSQRLSTRQFTSFADLELTQRILNLAATQHEKISVRFARDLHLRELRTDNLIFVGSPYSNPWVELFAKRRNFPTSLDAQSHHAVVKNRQPKAGEPGEFVMRGEDGTPGPTYGVLAFLPADSQSGNVLLLDGLNMEGTEAAGAFLTEARAARSLMDRIGLRAGAEKRYLEVVVETKAMAGTTRDSSVAAFRVGAPVK